MDATEPVKQVADLQNVLAIPTPVYIVMLFITGIFAYCIFTNPDMQNSYFLITQMTIDFGLMVFVAFMIGLLTLTSSPDSFVTNYSTAILPISLILVIWLKSYLTYAVNLADFCGGKDNVQSYQSIAILFNTMKIAISVFIVYSFLAMFPTTTTLFFELFGSSHPIIYYLGIGTWIGASTWPGEASAFYSLQSAGCVPESKITFNDLTVTATNNQNLEEYA